jgi:hypothetical protein
MRHVVRLALTAGAVALLPLGALAQGTQFFAQPYQYSDTNGVGTLTVTPLNSASTRLTYQPVRVTLVQNNVYSVGSGVYHAFTDDNANLPPFALLSFALVNPAGSSRFYQVTLAALNGYAGDGTSYPVTAPQIVSTWHVQSMPVPPVSIMNNAPVLNNGWYMNGFTEAMGGLYYSTFNTFQVPVSTATWSGTVPIPGNYLIEVFIPRQPSPGAAPRTNRATYQIFLGGIVGVALRMVNQQVSASQWIPLGTFSLQGSYQVMLTDRTGEPQQTRSVVADAIRLTPVR